MSAPPNIYAETKRVFGDRELSKVEAHKWKMLDQPGVFMSIRKRDLHVDPEYQRKNVNNSRVLSIASAWSWLACGCLLVARRGDGSYWVYDGQHRKLAADKRSDIQELPCLVFNVDEKADEAAGFVRSNTVRGAMSAYNKFRAQIVAGESTALAIKSMVEEHGYTLSDQKTDFTICCVAALAREYENRPDIARRIFSLCVELSQGKPIAGDLYSALCYLETFLTRQALPSLLHETYSRRLSELGIDGLTEAMHRSVLYYQRGGCKINAEGILNDLNKGRRSRRIPSLINESASSEDEQ